MRKTTVGDVRGTVNPHPGLAEFVAYLSGGHEIAPITQFPARVGWAPDQPTFIYGLPLGDVVVYPDYLVFLTVTEDAPGMGYFVKSYFRMLATELRTLVTLNHWADNPEAFFLTMAKHLTGSYRQEDTLAKAMSCSNSIFVPLSAVRGAAAGHSLRQSNYIKVATTRSPLVICQDSAVGNLLGNLWSYVTAEWHPDVVELLSCRGRQNGGEDSV